MTSTRPPYDPELEEFRKTRVSTSPVELDLAYIQAVRQASADEQPRIESLIEGHDLEHFEIDVPGLEQSPDVTLSIIRRPNRKDAATAIYNIHGGGMMRGNRYFTGKHQVELALRCDATIVSVEYRLAPEDPHPAPVNDCFAGLLWLSEKGAEIGVDPTRILLYGSSAGGGLAAAVAFMARDRGGPALIGQLLVAPMLDDRNDTVSAQQCDDPIVWNNITNEVGWTALLGEARGTPGVSEYGAPARATDMSGLPPTFIDVGSAEVFRDEALTFASRIWAVGGEAELHVWQGVFHGAGSAEWAVVNQGAADARWNWLKRMLRA